MITQSHVCEISSCQPPLRSAKKLRRSPSRRLRDRRSSASEVALTAKVAESTTKTLPGFVVAATTPATAGPDDEGEAARETEERVRLLEPLRADRRRDEPGCGRLEERLGGSVDRDEDDELPQLGAAREQQDRHRRLDDAADEVGDEHDHLPRQAVRPHASGQDEDDERQRLGREDDPEVGRASR